MSLTASSERWGTVWILAPVVLAAPFLAFPLVRPWLTIGVLVLASSVILLSFSGAVRAGEGRWRRTPLRLPLIALAIMMLVGAMASPFPLLTIPKLAGMVLGLLVYRAVLLTGTTSRRLWSSARAFFLIGCATSVAGVFSGPDWQHKFSFLLQVGERIPRLIPGLPGAEAGANPNALGGTTLLFLPALVALLASGAWAVWKKPAWPGWATVADWLISMVLIVALICVLVLSQSRGAWTAAILSCFLMLSLKFKNWALACGAAAALVSATAWTVGASTLLRMSHDRFASVMGPILNDDRPLIWAFAVKAVTAKPLTGVGLGAFREVIHGMSLGGVPPPLHVPHAHNQFLQVALDVGVPGLIAYIAILVLATLMTWRVQRHATDRMLRALCLGLWGSLMAMHWFTLFDAIALGSKAGVFFWWNLGLIASVHATAISVPWRSATAVPTR